MNLDLTQHPVDIREAIVTWSAENADRIANADPVNRERFVKSWTKAIDAIDKVIDPDADIAFGGSMDKEPVSACYSGTFGKAALGDEDRLMKAAEDYLASPAEVDEMREFVATGKFTQYLVSGERAAEDEHMINVLGSAHEDVTNADITATTEELDRIKEKAANIGLDPETYEQRIIAGAYDRRMEREWMLQDMRQVAAHHDINIGTEVGADKALNIVYQVYDYVESSIQKMQQNHLALEGAEQTLAPTYEQDHTGFVERSRPTINMMKQFKTAVFDSKADELAFVEDFKQTYGTEGIKALAKGDLDVISDLADSAQERRDIAYATLKVMKRNPSANIDAHDIEEGMDRYNPSIWHGQDGHSI